MLAYFFLGVALLGVLILLARWFVNADPRALAQGLRIAAVAAGVLLLAFVLVSGRWNLLPALLFTAVPWLSRMRGLAGAFGGGPRPGQSSCVETRYLRMQLDHDSGEMGGEVLYGSFCGRRLGDMSFVEQVALLRECNAEDPQSARLLEAYMDRVHGTDWRQRAGAGEERGAGGDGAAMSREEAYQVLGLDPGASAEEIKAAYRRLISRIHPDTGGSAYLAAKLNQAREVLLGHG